jgi:hypothetical protein
MAVILRPHFGVFFFKRGISPSKMGPFAPFLATIQPFSKTRVFCTKLKVLLSGLYVFNGQLDIPVCCTYLLKRTVEFWMHTKIARATLISVNI